VLYCAQNDGVFGIPCKRRGQSNWPSGEEESVEISQWGLLTYLIIVWAAVTLGFIGMMMYRGILSQREEDQLFLDKAEDHMAKEQQQIVARLIRLSKPIKALGITSGALLLVIAGLWIWEGLKSF
jgi:hypothetical protein